MKTIGLLGGMSWESTAHYYKVINEGINRQLGELHSAKICLYSVDFQEIEHYQRQGEWGKAAAILSRGAQSIEAAGADFLLICTNTMHKVAAEIEAAISIPLVHIADVTAQQLVVDKVQRVGLIGTQFTMSQNFYKGRLAEKFGIDVIVPNADEQKTIHDIIYTELCLGTIKDQSRDQYLDVIHCLGEQGAEAIILGCTEIGLLIQSKHTPAILYDTTEIHAQQAVKLALAK